MKIVYPCQITKNNKNKYSIKFLDFQEIAGEAETLEKAQTIASEILTKFLETLDANKIWIPRPKIDPELKQRDDIYEIPPSPHIQSALLIRFSMGRQTKANLARILNASWPSIGKLDDLNQWASLKQVTKVASVLGKRIVIEFEDEYELQEAEKKK